jgi:hypothetical protein
MIDLVITGTADFERAARALRQHGSKGQRGQFAKAINSATKPLRAAAKVSAATTLPQRGGLARQVARSRLTTRRRASGAGAGVRIQARGIDQLALIDRGLVVHPTFGRRPRVAQPVAPGWFSRPMQAGAPVVRQELVKVMRETVDKIARAS